MEAFGEITQGIVGERSRERKISARRRAHQCFDRMKTVLAEDLADQQGPQQQLCRNLGLSPTVSRFPKVLPKSKTPRHKVPLTTSRRTVHRFFVVCFVSGRRARTNNLT